MPRKPKQEIHRLNVIVNGKAIAVTLYPPTGSKKTWYVYWVGMNYAKSTGHKQLRQAVIAAEDMLRNNGTRTTILSNVMTDDEFIQIQRKHFAKRKAASKQEPSKKTLLSCLEAISAFKELTGLEYITQATAADCETFQEEACKKPKNWRSPYGKEAEEEKKQKEDKEKDIDCLKANTVVKWSRTLQAAWNRACKNAGKKRVNVATIAEDKYLERNPWCEFTWIGGEDKPKDYFGNAELLSMLLYFEREWTDVSVALLYAKLLLWSADRKSFVASLKWDALRQVDDEYHFEIISKHAVRRWFRIPARLYEQLCEVRVAGNPFVFAAYVDQLKRHHQESVRPWQANQVFSEFSPERFADWFYNRIKAWAENEGIPNAYVHVFRKTTLQFARSGEDINERVAKDARVGKEVMMRHYVHENDPELWMSSNRMFERVRCSLSDAVAIAYGDDRTPPDPLLEQLRAAQASQDWAAVAKIAAELERRSSDS